MQTPSATVAAIAGVIASSIVVVVLTSMYEGLPARQMWTKVRVMAQTQKWDFPSHSEAHRGTVRPGLVWRQQFEQHDVAFEVTFDCPCSIESNKHERDCPETVQQKTRVSCQTI